MFFISSLPAQVTTTFWVSMADVTICNAAQNEQTVTVTSTHEPPCSLRPTVRGHVSSSWLPYLHVVLVNVLEALRLLWQLLDNVAAREDSLHVHPHVLHDQPLLNDLRDGAELDDPGLHLVPEGGAVPTRHMHHDSVGVAPIVSSGFQQPRHAGSEADKVALQA